MLTVTIELQGGTQTRQLEKKTTVIGRSRSADIRIDHPSVSGRHARIELADDGSAEVFDAGSRNGLLVDDRKTDHVAVTDGLAVTIGPARVLFKTGGGQARAETLQRLQLPDPGASGISPPPAPGSGLGTTPRAPALLELSPPPPVSARAPRLQTPRRSRRAVENRFSLENLLAALSATGSLSVSIGLHAFVALLLTVCVYRQIHRESPHPLIVSLEMPKAAVFKAPEVRRDGDGGGLPGGMPDVKWTERPAAEDTEPELSLDAAELPEAGSPGDAAPRTGRVAPPAITISKGSKAKRFIKVVDCPDPEVAAAPGKAADGGLAVAKKAGGAGGGGVEIKPDDDPAALVIGNVSKGRGGGWQTVAEMEPGEIEVVTGDYDTVQRVLDRLKLRYKTVEARKLGGEKLSSVRVLMLNCPASLDGSGILKLRDFVNRGGWVVSTDWALSAIKEAFPGTLTHVALSPESWVPIEAAEAEKKNPLLTDVFGAAGGAPKWYLEQRSYLFGVDAKAKDKVKVLIESAEMKRRWNTGCVAATFDYGKGRVLHIVSHLQQVSTDPKASYAMYQFLANWLIEAAVGTKPGEGPAKK